MGKRTTEIWFDDSLRLYHAEVFRDGEYLGEGYGLTEDEAWIKSGGVK